MAQGKMRVKITRYTIRYDSVYLTGYNEHDIEVSQRRAMPIEEQSKPDLSLRIEEVVAYSLTLVSVSKKNSICP